MSTTEAPERVRTVLEVAQHLGVAHGVVYRMIQRGELRAVRVGRLIRVPESALNDFLAGR